MESAKPQKSRIHNHLARSRDGSFKYPNMKKTGRDVSIIDRCYFAHGLIEDGCLYSLNRSRIRMLFCCDVPPSSATDMPFLAFAQSYCGSYNTPSTKSSPLFPVNYESSPYLYCISPIRLFSFIRSF